MQLQGQAQRVTVYIGEGDHYHGQSLYMALLEFLKREGAAGATVTRGLAGFGAHSRIHTATIIDLSADLPIRVEWVDTAATVERLLPDVRKMVNDGMIMVDEVNVVQYAPGRQPDPLAQPVHNIMRTEVLTVQPETPIAQVVTLLLERGYRSLPVVANDGRLLGIITDGDLLRRANLRARLDLQTELSTADLQRQLTELQTQAKRAADVMTEPVITVKAGDAVRQAVALMAQHSLKRLPVVDPHGRLVGLISRVDVLRAVEYHQNGFAQGPELPHTGATVADLMYTDVPTVRPDAQLEEIVRALEASRRRRAVVVDADRHVLGIITDGDLLRRSQRAPQPTLLKRLRNLVTGKKEQPTALPDAGETAAHLMSTPVVTVQPDTALGEALRLMLVHQIKRLPVVDADGRLVGMLGRASLLHGLLGESATPDASQASVK
jgi:CBS domain-containing protein